MGKRYAGQTRSGNQDYPDFGGDGRADLHKINPDTNIGQNFFNIRRNKGGSGLDDPGMQDPHDPGPAQCPFVCDDTCIPDDDDDNLPSQKRVFQKRKAGESREILVPGLAIILYVITRRYPPLDDFLDRTAIPGQITPNRRHVLLRPGRRICEDYDPIRDSCDDSNGRVLDPLPASWRTPRNPPIVPRRITQAQLDHPLDLQTMAMFLSFAITGERLDGSMIPQKDRIPEQNMAATWQNPTGLPLNAISQTPNDFVMSAYEDMDNIMNFIPLDQEINNMKGDVFGGLAPLNVNSFRQRLLAAAGGNQANQAYLERQLNTFWAMFQYFNSPEFTDAFDHILDDLDARMTFIDGNCPPLQGIRALWTQWRADYLPHIVQVSYNWAFNTINEISDVFGDVPTNPQLAAEMRRLANYFMARLDEIHIGSVRPKRRQDEPQ